MFSVHPETQLGGLGHHLLDELVVDRLFDVHALHRYAGLAGQAKSAPYRAVGGPVISESSGKNNRGRFYLYCRQQGIWPKEVAGVDPDKEPRAFDKWCPIRNVTAAYPPTLLIHIRSRFES